MLGRFRIARVDAVMVLWAAAAFAPAFANPAGEALSTDSALSAPPIAQVAALHQRDPPGPLQWADCGLLLEKESLKLVSYTQDPDPVVVDAPWASSSTFTSLLDTPIQNLTGEFKTYKRNKQNTDWDPIFSTAVTSRCGSGDFQVQCPIGAHSNFTARAHHGSTKMYFGPGLHMSLELYYVDGVIAGCATAAYRVVAPEPPLGGSEFLV